jgi:hypothetical protein
MFPPLAGKPLPRKRRREELAARALRDVAGYGESFSAAASAAAHAV